MFISLLVHFIGESHFSESAPGNSAFLAVTVLHGNPNTQKKKEKNIAHKKWKVKHILLLLATVADG